MESSRLNRLSHRRNPAFLASVGACLLLTLQPSPGAAQTAAPPPAGAVAPAGAVGGMGDVNIYPKRIVLDSKTRLSTMGLYNRTANAGEYEISIADRLMRPDGSLVELGPDASPADRAKVSSASGLVKWSPRRVALGASEAQAVHVMLRVPPNTAPGEYRSHFTIAAVPPVDEGLTIDDAAGKIPEGGIGVRIVPRFGISIPVIVRIGETTLTAGLRDIALVNGPQGRSLALTITREGTRSAFGDITVTAAGSKLPIAEIMGVGVYTEVNDRRVMIPINPKADPRFLAKGTRLTLTYTDDDAAPGKTLARQEFIVP